eukprot:gb/GECG01005407.1/.p1 GENE.gb/GECG01005407.1/~~gb/GECG01005407.1/.p1  ORF type:complete len:386 (+),score=34.05 gb/GECG01005407.1/:1-1158(+)
MDSALGIRSHIEPCVPYDATKQEEGYFNKLSRAGYPFPVVRITHDNEHGRQVELKPHTFLGLTRKGAMMLSDMKVHNDGETSSEAIVLKSIDEMCLEPVNAPGERPTYRVFDGNGRLTSVSAENPVMELKIMRELQGRHHIMSLMDYCRVSGMHYMAMPYANLSDLLDFVQERQGLREDLAKYIFCQVLEGVLFLHSNGFCHRDISLENVLLRGSRDRPFAIVSNFGLAAVTGLVSEFPDQLEPGVGKRGYKAPELLKKGYNGFVTDMFALGSLLYMMITCSLPTNRWEYIDQHGFLHPDMEQGLTRKGFPRNTPLHHFIQTLVQTHPEDRFPNGNHSVLPPTLGLLEHMWLDNDHSIPQESIEEFRSRATYVARSQSAYARGLL